jgi:ATP-dependent RNA helicase DeaD
MVILDEADEMFSMFIEDIECCSTRPRPAPDCPLRYGPLPIRRLADRYMHDPQVVFIKGEPLTVEAIEQRYYLVNAADKLALLDCSS